MVGTLLALPDAFALPTARRIADDRNFTEAVLGQMHPRMGSLEHERTYVPASLLIQVASVAAMAWGSGNAINATHHSGSDDAWPSTPSPWN